MQDGPSVTCGLSSTIELSAPKHCLELDGAGSAEFAVSERAHAIAYYRGGKVVHRREVQLVPLRLNKLAP